MALAFVVLVATAVTDYVWARLIFAMEHHKVLEASVLSGLLQGGAAVVVVAYMGNNALIGASMVGAALGTGFAVLKEKRRAAKS